jgi:hypothetical protein
MLIISFIWRELISLKSHGLISGKSKSLLVENSHPTYLLRSKEKSKKLDALFLHRQLVFMEQLMGKKFVLKLPLWGTTSWFDLSEMGSS